MDRQNDDTERARDFLVGVVERMNIDAEVVAKNEDEKIVLTIECRDDDDTQRIIGRRGQVLDSLQHVVNKVLAKGRERGPQAIVDAGGYRARHIERLEGLARKMADKAMSTGESVPLSPMSPFDRRVVHMALADMDGVRTESDGEGESRHVVVIPT